MSLCRDLVFFSFVRNMRAKLSCEGLTREHLRGILDNAHFTSIAKKVFEKVVVLFIFVHAESWEVFFVCTLFGNPFDFAECLLFSSLFRSFIIPPMSELPHTSTILYLSLPFLSPTSIYHKLKNTGDKYEIIK